MSSSGGSDDIPTVTVRRRRRPTTPSGQRETADAPTRDQRPPSAPPPRPPSGGGGYIPPSGGSYPTGGGSSYPSGGSGYRPPSSGGGGGIPGGRMGLIGCLGLVAVLIVGGIIMSMLGRGSDRPAQQPSSMFGDQQAQAPLVQPTEPPLVVATQAPAVQPTLQLATGNSGVSGSSGASGGQTAGGDTWTIMLYQDADDRILEQDIYVDLNEAERVGSTDKVKIVAQIDRYKGGFSGDGNWTQAGRFLVKQDNDLNRLRSEVLADLGEVNMADGRTLVDFVTWAMKTYPADKYALILSDHGMGWPGGLSDPDPQAGPRVNVPLSRRLGNMMYLNEFDAALTEIRRQTGLDKFELIGLDACLMGHLEVYNALQPHARYAVTSQETEPALGWAYSAFLSALNRNPAMAGDQLGSAIVETYIDQDQRIVDDQARAELVGARGFGVPPASQLSAQMAKDITLSAANLDGLPALNQAVNNMAYVLQGEDQRLVAQARQYSQSFTSIFGQGTPPSYIDLAHFSALLNKNTDNAEVRTATEQVVRAMQGVVVREKSGSGKPGAFGASIYFPVSQIYQNAVAGPQSYTGIATRFASNSLWDEFLNFHYTGRQFQPSDAGLSVPDRAIESPVAGGISATPIEKDSNFASPSNPVLLSTEISGENVGYVKLLVGYLDEANRSVAILDKDYLESAETREQNGVYYPVWPETGKFRMQFEWEPVVFAIDDGAKTAVALFEPETYGESFENARYSVDGIYRFADGESRPAKLYFRNGLMQSVYGFNTDDGEGSAREIVPQKGDKFTILEQWMDIDSQGKAMEITTEEGETLTFGDDQWSWVDLNAAPGRYIVGFVVEDLDANEFPVYDQVTVTN
jgi:hypothetical protein